MMRTKTLTLTVALATLLSLGFFTANAGTPKLTVKSATSAKIERAVSLPEELRIPGYNRKVKVCFIVDGHGQVQQAAAITSNLALKQKLESQFKQLVLTELAAGTYNVEINFNVY